MFPFTISANPLIESNSIITLICFQQFFHNLRIWTVVTMSQHAIMIFKITNTKFHYLFVINRTIHGYQHKFNILVVCLLHLQGYTIWVVEVQRLKNQSFISVFIFERYVNFRYISQEKSFLNFGLCFIGQPNCSTILFS